MASSFVLYSYFRSSASYRARIALNLKGITYEYKAVHLLKDGGEHLSDDYKKLNPSQQVPTLMHEGLPVSESLAIIDYLDRVQPEPRLFPEDAYKRARVLQACEIVNSGTQPLHNLSMLRHLGKRYQFDEAAKSEWTIHWLTRGLNALETFLKPQAGNFSFGDTPCAADCFVIPNLANADRYKVSLEAYPTLARVRQSCDKLEAFAKAAPSAQPDFQP